MWHRTVSDLMTTSVVKVHRDTALVPLAVRLARAVEGVVDVEPQLTGGDMVAQEAVPPPV
ncbi:hypothetical protein [Streptomyces sp. NPDC059805]|uniref:hypothetical protein n=1 Tax=Streptomyces sp. NPDC059805 TaxID=3346954 RepID=UPI00365D0FB2